MSALPRNHLPRRHDVRLPSESGVFVLPDVPCEALWRALDNGLDETLSERAVRVTMRSPERRSVLDAVATSLVHCRRTLATLTGRAATSAVAEYLANDRRAVRAIMGAYRFCSQLSTELLAIEMQGVGDADERAEASALLPRALRSFDQGVLPLFEDLGFDGGSEEIRAFMWDMPAIRLAISRALSTLIAIS